MFISNKPSGLSNIVTYERTIFEVNWESPSFKIIIRTHKEYKNIQVQYNHFVELTNKEKSKRNNDQCDISKYDTSTKLPGNNTNNNVGFNDKSDASTNLPKNNTNNDDDYNDKSTASTNLLTINTNKIRMVIMKSPVSITSY